MKFDLTTVSVWLAAFAPMGVLILAMVIDRRRRKHIERPPQTEKLLRPPGHSLSIRLEEIQDVVLLGIFLAFIPCAIAGASVIATVQLLAAHAPVLWLASALALLVVSSASGVWVTLRAFRHFREAQNIRLGLRGEQAVAEVLHEVADSGFRAFHDLPGDGDWNIDHVAVGTRGVFLIETKARRRRPSRNGQPEHVVIYDGKILQFPAGYDANAVPQAERNARWLSNHLTKKTGENVSIQALIVLPGWFVEQGKGNFNVKAMNAAYLAGFLRRQDENLDPAQVRRLITALDEKCRTLDF